MEKVIKSLPKKLHTEMQTEKISMQFANDDCKY